jgi:hypothetical protein
MIMGLEGGAVLLREPLYHAHHHLWKLAQRCTHPARL